MAIIVDESTNLVIVEDPQAQVFVRDLWTAIQEFLDEPGGLHIANFAKISGDDFISDDGQQVTRVGLTLILFAPWLLEFEARAGPSEEAMIVVGGSLIGDSGTEIAPAGDGSNPISPSAFTQVTIAQSPSPTIDELSRLLTKSQFLGLKDT